VTLLKNACCSVLSIGVVVVDVANILQIRAPAPLRSQFVQWPWYKCISVSDHKKKGAMCAPDA
jgi:hypothetical protein